MDEHRLHEQLSALRQRVEGLALDSSPQMPTEDLFTGQMNDVKRLITDIHDKFTCYQATMRADSQPHSPSAHHIPPPTAQTTLPSGPIFWDLFRGLRSDMDALENRVARFETGLANLEDRVDALEPTILTPPESVNEGADLFATDASAAEAPQVAPAVTSPEVASDSSWQHKYHGPAGPWSYSCGTEWPQFSQFNAVQPRGFSSNADSLQTHVLHPHSQVQQSAGSADPVLWWPNILPVGHSASTAIDAGPASSIQVPTDGLISQLSNGSNVSNVYTDEPSARLGEHTRTHSSQEGWRTVGPEGNVRTSYVFKGQNTTPPTGSKMSYVDEGRGTVKQSKVAYTDGTEGPCPNEVKQNDTSYMHDGQGPQSKANYVHKPESSKNPIESRTTYIFDGDGTTKRSKLTYTYEGEGAKKLKSTKVTYTQDSEGVETKKSFVYEGEGAIMPKRSKITYNYRGEDGDEGKMTKVSYMYEGNGAMNPQETGECEMKPNTSKISYIYEGQRTSAPDQARVGYTYCTGSLIYAPEAEGEAPQVPGSEPETNAIAQYQATQDQTINELNEKLESCRATMEEDSKTKTRLTQERDDFNRAFYEMAAIWRERDSRLQEQISEQQRTIEAKEGEIEELQDKYSELTSDLDEWKANWQQLQHSWQHVSGQARTAFRHLNEERERRYRELDEMVEDHEAELKHLQAEYDKSRALAEEQQAAIARDKELFEKRDFEIEELQERIRGLESELRASRAHMTFAQHDASQAWKSPPHQLSSVPEYDELGRRWEDYDNTNKERRTLSNAPGTQWANRLVNSRNLRGIPLQASRPRHGPRFMNWESYVSSDSEHDGSVSSPLLRGADWTEQPVRDIRRRALFPPDYRDKRNVTFDSVESKDPRLEQPRAESSEMARPQPKRMSDNTTIRPPLPAPVACRRLASDSDIRATRASSDVVSGRKTLTKHHSVQGLRRRRLQAFVESGSETGGGELGGEV